MAAGTAGGERRFSPETRWRIAGVSLPELHLDALQPCAKHGGGGMMVWEPGSLAVTDWTRISSQSFLESDVDPSVQQLDPFNNELPKNKSFKLVPNN